MALFCVSQVDSLVWFTAQAGCWLYTKSSNGAVFQNRILKLANNLRLRQGKMRCQTSKY